MSKCLKFCPGIEIFKADFHSKICVCRHELGVLPHPQPSGNSNFAYGSSYNFVTENNIKVILAAGAMFYVCIASSICFRC